MINRTKKLSNADIQRYLGDAKKVAEEMEQYKKDCIFAEQSKFCEVYEHKWIVVYKEKVQATGSTLDVVMRKANEKHLPRGSIVVRFQTKDKPPVFLFDEKRKPGKRLDIL